MVLYGLDCILSDFVILCDFVWICVILRFWDFELKNYIESDTISEYLIEPAITAYIYSMMYEKIYLKNSWKIIEQNFYQ